MDTGQPRTFGALLKDHRLAAGVSQEQLAERAGLTAQAISALERGFRRAPYRDTVRALARALALSPADAAALAAAVPRGRADMVAAPERRPVLPLPPSPLVGRVRELAEVEALLHGTLAGSPVRLLTLTGPGGVGKTRLALQVAHAVADRYADGAVFVALAPLRDPTLVIAAIAQALRATEDGRRPLPDAVRLHLRDKHLLLLLDNCEHVVAATPVIADLLSACPGLRVLATSRARLHLSGEHLYLVPPLRTPDPERLPALADLAEVPAVALLVQRAQAAVPGFALDAAAAPAIAALCGRLDGLPLALELVAPRLAVLSPALLLRRLTSRLRLLTDGARDLPERQRSLRATLDWSYALLSPGEQAAFRRLSVVPASCTLEAAEAVCAAGDLDAAASPSAGRDMVDWIGALIDKSLLQREVGPEGEPRVAMLETVREFGLERLEEAGEGERARRAHALHYLALAEEGAPALVGPEQRAWGARLERERDNLRAALAWACAARETATAQRLASALWRFWLAHGPLSEGRRWLRDALALDDADHGGTQDGDGDGDAGAAGSPRTAALAGAAMLAVEQGAFDEAAALCAEGVALARARGAWRGLALALNAQGRLDCQQGRYVEAAVCHREALSVARERGDRAGEAAALAGLARAVELTGDASAARTLHEQSLAVSRALGDTRGRAEALTALMMGALYAGAHARAEALGAEGLTLLRALGDDGRTAEALWALGMVAQTRGHHERARALHEESLALRQARGDERMVAHSRLALGSIALQQADLPRARALLSEVRATLRPYGDRWAEAIAVTVLGHVELAAGDLVRAQALCGEGATLFQAIGNPLYLSYCLEGLAGVAVARGQATDAARLCGARDALLARLRTGPPPAHPTGYARTLATARATLGEDAFAAMQQEGRATAPDDAIAAALERGSNETGAGSVPR